MSIQRPITKKSYVTCKKPLNALCEKRLQSSMFKWPSFYYFLEFHCKILNSYAIYRCKKMVKIFNCYFYAKKVIALCLRVQFFLANSVYWLSKSKTKPPEKVITVCSLLLSFLCNFHYGSAFQLNSYKVMLRKDNEISYLPRHNLNKRNNGRQCSLK